MQNNMKPKKIIISHVYSLDNKGDAALLSVLLSDLRSWAINPEINILSVDYLENNQVFEKAKMSHSFMYYAYYQYNSRIIKLLYCIYIILITTTWAVFKRITSKSLPINKNLKEICELYNNTDLIVPVGGGYIRGQKNIITSLVNICLLLHPFILSYILQKPTVLYSQSIGPFYNKIEIYCVRLALNKCIEAALIREDISVDLLNQIGVKSNIYRTIDAGFAFMPSGKEYDVKKILNIKNNSKIFGITARQWLSKNAQHDYEKTLAYIAQYIAQKYGAHVIFIPQVTSEFHSDDDRKVYKRIKKFISVSENIHYIDDKLSHDQIKYIYNSLDYIIGTRFHSVIFSLTSFVPSIAIDYEHKTSGIMRDLELSEWVIGINDVNKANLSMLVDKLIAQHDSYLKVLERTIPKYSMQAKSSIKYVESSYNSYLSKHAK